MNCLSPIIALFTLIYPIAPNRTPDQTIEASLLLDGQTGPVTNHGSEKEVKAVWLGRDGQQRYLVDLHRLVRMAHERGIRVTFGSRCNDYHNPALATPVDPTKPAVLDIGSGRIETNLVPYAIAAISPFLKKFPKIINVLLLMMDDSSLTTTDTKPFWRGIFSALKKVVPDIQNEFRAKRVSDDLIRQVLDLGLKIWANIKFWIEQVDLPNFHNHGDLLDQPTRPGTYASTIQGLQILSDLPAYYSPRSAAGMSLGSVNK
jgi:hypothetical protein